MRLSKKFKAVAAASLIICSTAFFNACEHDDSNNNNITNDNTDGGVYTGGDNDGTGGDIPDDTNSDMDWENKIKTYTVLSDDMIKESDDEILPVDIKPTNMTYSVPTDENYFNKDLDTRIFLSSQFEEGKCYYFKGSVDEETGRVNDRIVVLGTIKNVLIEVEDAQFTAEYVYGDSQINMTVPCKLEYTWNGLLYQFNPKEPFGGDEKVPLVKYTEKTDKTDIRAPQFSLKQVGETKPKVMLF